MASLFRGGWTGATPKNALVSCGLTLLFVFTLVSPSTGQVAEADRSKRKIIRTVEPDYPKIIKHSHIGGSVRLNVTVLANGDVANVEILGGNPILADSASKAVFKWKYAPATSQTKQEVQINFDPD
ncbi:MAG TPA: energy transducer TonB [Terriglobales bacterium]|nr:energy transducer TonB [Terriglobales bacterium]